MRAVLLLLGNAHFVHKVNYMFEFYAVQRWSSYAYSAANLKVGGVYLMLCYVMLCYLQIVHFVEAFLCVM